jgi:hypothetical protein
MKLDWLDASSKMCGDATEKQRGKLLEMRCDGCKNWTTAKVTGYSDGSEVINWKAPDGKGRCDILKIDTTPEFGCVSFAQIPAGSLVLHVGAHIQKTWKNGAPWMHHIVGPCPDCRGRGSDSGVCNRCAGTGKVRYYDDGFIGEEQTRLHPMEKNETLPLKCPSCGEIVKVKWMACPMCGRNLVEPPAETEYVDGLGNAGGDFKNEAKTKRASDLNQDINAMNDRNEKIAALRRMTTDNGCTLSEADTAAAMADKLEAMAR